MLPMLTVLISAALLNSAAASHSEDTGFLQCQECFFRGKPPESLSELGLEPRCHTHLSGRPFASLFNNNCQSTVFTALQLGLNNGWGRGEQSTQDGQEEIDGSPHEVIPALYRTNADETPSATPFQKWDTLTAELLRDSIIPQCSEVNGQIYVQTGVGGFNQCGAKLMWSAVCCSASDASFSVGLVKEWDVEKLSIQTLEERIGVANLFSGGCGEFRHQSGEELGLVLEPQPNVAKSDNSEVLGEETTQETGSLESILEDVSLEQLNGETASEPALLNTDMDLEESTNETESSESVILYVLSSTVYFLYAPFSPIVNRVVNLPFQLTYVIQEDLAVLVSVPCDSCTLVKNLISGLCSGVSCIFNTLYQIGETTVCMLYDCLSPLVISLALTFQEGLFGMGTLVSESLGIAIGTVENGVALFRMLFRLILGDSVEYLSTLSFEVGHQATIVGSGVGTLTWRSGKGVGHALNFMMSIVGGMVGNSISNIQEVLGVSSGESPVLQTPEILTSEVVGE